MEINKEFKIKKDSYNFILCIYKSSNPDILEATLESISTN